MNTNLPSNKKETDELCVAKKSLKEAKKDNKISINSFIIAGIIFPVVIGVISMFSPEIKKLRFL